MHNSTDFSRIKHGITVTGSAAILLSAKQSGKIDLVKPLLDRLRGHGYRLSDRLIVEIMKRAGEH